jgi:methionyl aminopeptidase
MSREFIHGMERACKLAAQVLEKTGQQVKAGVTTNDLNDWADMLTLSAGATSAPLGYHGFPKSICTSVNDVLTHGVPDDTALKDGDIINIDITVILDGYHGDCSATYFVGPGEPPKIIQAAKEAMMAGIGMVRAGGHTGDIGWASEWSMRANGFFPDRYFGGHGIGKSFHTAPHVPSYGTFGEGEILKANTCITVEPIVCATPAPIYFTEIPNSTIRLAATTDKSLTACFEHTVLITPTGYVILTLP